ncbi:uncharacterized protein [Physcomitrium patens]|uniref:Uncharacterized protein n=1 Tax=Physcomitrium patens TaxID=3218 RepID=A0A7I4CBJ6_PHYPA|nr:uncharacterized protein LOC112275300 isoform X2 [Physcomitrium patens]|eukprot:XP_024361318.1 uncharacterized protein LOC112275300 isoform X2 [Physcomitrella patens]
MASTGPPSTEVDSPLAESRNPTPAKLLSASDGQGFRPVGLASSGLAAVDTTISLGPVRPSPGLTSQAHSNAVHQPSPLQHHHHQGGGSQTVGHFPGSHTIALPAHLSPHLSGQRQPQHIVGTGGNPRQHHHPVQMVAPNVASKISHSQGSPSGLGGNQLGKSQLLLHRPQGTSQDKVGLPQKPTASSQRQAMQRAHTRTAGWQSPLGQHVPGTPSSQSRMFYQHPVLNAQVMSSPPEQSRLHPTGVSVVPQQFPQQQQLRDVGPTGVKSMPIYPILRTPVAGNYTSNHSDTPYRERSSDSQIVVHIGDRKVRLASESDPSSLYSLCRRWVRNDILRSDRAGTRDVMNLLLPKPLSVAEVESAGDHPHDNCIKSDADQPQSEIEKSVDDMTPEELLQLHVQQYRLVRKRSKEERMRKIARFKPRLALLLPGNNESC